MSLIVVDVESDGPTPADRSMVCFGAVLVSDMSKTFYGQTKPINPKWDSNALAISGFTREEHEEFEDPMLVMFRFEEWVKEVSTGQPVFISDNNGYDWSWINFYFHKYCGRNPFGWSSRRIGDLYCGMQKDTQSQWKHLRKTKHTHNPVDDAMGNAEAIIAMKQMGLKIKL